MMSIDVELLHVVQSWQPAWLTMVMRTISALCTPEIVLPVCGVVLVILALRHKRWQELTLLAILAGNGLAVIIKPMIHRPRPTILQAHVLEVQGNASMPSGHALAAITIGAAILLLAHHHRRASWWMVCLVSALVVLVGISRVYLGAHWPSDVAVSWMLGWTWSIAVWQWVRPRIQHRWPGTKNV